MRNAHQNHHGLSESNEKQIALQHVHKKMILKRSETGRQIAKMCYFYCCLGTKTTERRNRKRKLVDPILKQREKKSLVLYPHVKQLSIISPVILKKFMAGTRRMLELHWDDLV